MIFSLLDLFYPLLCFACNRNSVKKGQTLCISCEYKISPTSYHQIAENPVSERFYGRVNIDMATAAFTFSKGGLLQNLIHSLKYENRPEIGIELGKIYGSLIRNDSNWKSFDYIIPVPLHPKKKHLRGYNQAEMWAIGLSESLNIPVRTDLLIRNEFTDSQTKKSRTERFKNVENVFSVTDSSVLTDKKILLVDDVLTTGATLEACAMTLSDSSKVKISIACIALAS